MFTDDKLISEPVVRSKEDGKRTYTVLEIAALLRISKSKAYKLCKSRKKTAQRFEEEFYGTRTDDEPDAFAKQFFSFCENNPKVLAQLKALLAANQ